MPEWLKKALRCDSLERRCREGKIRWTHTIEEMVIFSRGESPDPALDHFFNLFSIKGLSNQAVRQRLRAAWWVEEEEVRQALDIGLLKIKYASKRMHPVMIARILGTCLRSYLLTTKFYKSYPPGLIELIEPVDSIEHLEVIMDARALLSKLPLRLQYFLYLYYIVGFSEEEIATILACTSRMCVYTLKRSHELLKRFKKEEDQRLVQCLKRSPRISPSLLANA